MGSFLFARIIFLYQIHDFPVSPGDIFIMIALMGREAAGAILDAVFGVFEVPLALPAQGIQRTIAEQAVEILGMLSFMAGKVFAFCILEEGIVSALRHGIILRKKSIYVM